MRTIHLSLTVRKYDNGTDTDHQWQDQGEVDAADVRAALRELEGRLGEGLAPVSFTIPERGLGVEASFETERAGSLRT